MKQHTVPQKLKILVDLLEGKTVSGLTGLQKYQCLNVRNRVGELIREDGFPVIKTRVTVESGKTVMLYKM
jgi:hypothetical protein